MPAADSDDFFLDEDDDESTALIGDMEDRTRTEADMQADWRMHRDGAGGRGSQRQQTMGIISVAVLAYFSTSGGPFGVEVGLAAGGPARVLIVLLTFTLLSASVATSTIAL